MGKNELFGWKISPFLPHEWRKGISLKFEVRKHYRIRDGRKVRCLAVDAASPFTHIFMLKGNSDSADGAPYPTDSQGRAYINGGQHNLDVIGEWNEPIQLSGWVNVYSTDPLLTQKNIQMITLYATQDEARRCANGQEIATVFMQTQQFGK